MYYFILWFCISLHFLIITSNEVESIRVLIGSDTTTNTVTGTLWFDYKIYQFSLASPSPSTEYIFYKDSSPIFTLLGCDLSTSDTKIMFENDYWDGVYIVKASFTTTAGELYAIDAVCIDSLYYPSDLLWNAAMCPSNHQYHGICVDNEDTLLSTGCGPSKQIMYFDTTRPNEWLVEAFWSEGTDVFPDPKTCATITEDPTVISTTSSPPTPAPSVYPSPKPTSHPTVSPTFTPSSNPTDPLTNTPTKTPMTNNEAQVEEDRTTTTYTPPVATRAIFQKRNTDLSPFWIMLIVFLSIIFSLLLCLIIVIIYKHNQNKSNVVLPKLEDDKTSHLVPGDQNEEAERDKAQITMANFAVTRIRVNTESQFAANDDEDEDGDDDPEEAEPDKNDIGLNIDDGVTSVTEGRKRGQAVTEGADEARISIFNERNEKQRRQLLKQWLFETVQLPQYYGVLVKNGYDSLHIVKEITEEAELTEIGIVLKGHLFILMKEIGKLKTK